MIRAVLDTNTIVSAIIVPAGIPANILAAARAGHLSISTSPPIVNEVLRALQRDRVRRKYHLTAAEIEGVRLPQPPTPNPLVLLRCNGIVRAPPPLCRIVTESVTVLFHDNRAPSLILLSSRPEARQLARGPCCR